MRAYLRQVTDVERPRVVLPVTISHGINEFYAIVIPPIIPLLVADFGISYGQAGLLLTVFFIMYSLFQLPAGVVADWIGKQRLLAVGLVGMTVGIAVAASATSFETLVIAQAIAGISGSTFHPAGLSIISDVETRGDEGKAMGIFGFGGTLGTLSAPLVVGGLAVVVGWRAALLGAVVLGGTMTIAVIYLIRSTRDSPEARPDGGVSVAERVRSARALVDLLATREIAVLCVLTFAMSMQHRAIQTFTTSFVTDDLGVSVTIGNLAFFTLLAGGSVASLWAGELADRMNRIHLGTIAALLTALLVAATLAVDTIATVVPLVLIVGMLLVWFCVMGFVMYASYPVKNALISEEADAAYSGSLFGVIQTGSSLGSASGPAVFGVLATEYGIAAAFPAIASVSLVLAMLFGLLGYLRRR